ncbi:MULTISPECIES: hypothetical protein [unclassified Mesorhizobium]|uniref:hypothetical protein n=1 Tax=unclassified Mesorhizobium TaxID=325217 RepID=UPI002415047A|nr:MULTISPECIES: hypothetical protein [unclassified Mesorhizobium]MDG4889997.1 hypothetical protein [Mesorhizobium sp. WSM4887]MDG4904139.1 hypothetical protein [Mesorhizobium sp. WSM4962]MDG4909166.1 hypothetical protein [Mesorhizobium sp. WSM4898]MDG4921790.1 hypothetical protein [Mesorhizobium sp. WSM4989]
MAQGISRISKLLVDRNGDDPENVLARRRGFTVTLRLGEDVAGSRSLQLAALTAARLAVRCFPGAVRIEAPQKVLDAVAVVGVVGKPPLREALNAEVGKNGWKAGSTGHVLLIGDAMHDGLATRITFDGWAAAAGPASLLSRYAEREHCSLAPVLAAALSVSEVFLAFARLDLQAGRRVIGMSLWRPDLSPTDPDAVGPGVTFLPRKAWLLGLGHLGNAYLWAISTLPYARPQDLLLYLLDFDKVELANTETGVLFRRRHIGQLKTRVCAGWLEDMGIETRLIERHVDEHLRRRDDEPALAFSGFDNNEARHQLVGAGFGRVVDSGLGGTATNFDSISLRTWPNARRPDDIWPLVSGAEQQAINAAIEKAAEANPGYRRLKRQACGLIQHAGKSVAVPFVGMTAATMVLADALRVLHDGGRIENLKVRLGAIASGIDVTWSQYNGDDLAAVAYTDARSI